ncbi:uncharacterized protein [Battus philenor]|uniref:uncharacterized protein n=1 Tax=Battus philenor TaxID=42288 RepID=UPI0035D025B0
MENRSATVKKTGKHVFIPNSAKYNKFPHGPKSLKKVISSKALIQNGQAEGKCCSTGTMGQPVHKPKKTTKSDLTFDKNVPNIYIKSGICKQCGDVLAKNSKTAHKNMRNHEKTVPTSSHYNDMVETPLKYGTASLKSNNLSNTTQESIHQYYKNEKFAQLSTSDYVTQSKIQQKPSLSTIREIDTSVPKSKSSHVLYEIYPESSPEEFGYFDYNKHDNIREINEFRRKNYFECHSAKSRVNTSSASSIGTHKCIYRFYLNERLFPVPINTDHHNNIRCIECKLPLDDTRTSSSINGTVQAKVKVENNVQDMMLLLPVKEPLIIKERRKELCNVVDPEILYFGIIKLNSNGDSIFNRTLPNNSLALKYQKGYRRYENDCSYKYHCVGDRDVVIK